MLETIREYAAERLDASTEADQPRPPRRALPGARRGFCAEPAAGGAGAQERCWTCSSASTTTSAQPWIGSRRRETQSVLQMAGALAEFWFANDHWVELRGRLIDALAADNQPTAASRRALIGAADIFAVDADIPSSRSCAEEALTFIERSENGRRWGRACGGLARPFSKNRISGQRRRSTNRPSRSSATWTINTRSST